MSLTLLQIFIAVAIFGGLAAVLDAGFRVGRVAAGRKKSDNTGSAQVGPIQGAVLGLVGLLLGFSFAGAASRFADRQDLITKEANAIGTAYLRADLLDAPDRAALQAALRQYVAVRLELFYEFDFGKAETLAATMSREHSVIWSAAIRGVESKPSVMMGILPSINEVIDLHTVHSVAVRRHHPPVVLALLIICSMTAIGAIGYGCGLAGKRHLSVSGAMTMLIAATLWTIIDMDYPRVGLIKMSPAPIEALKAATEP